MSRFINLKALDSFDGKHWRYNLQNCNNIFPTLNFILNTEEVCSIVEFDSYFSIILKNKYKYIVDEENYEKLINVIMNNKDYEQLKQEILALRTYVSVMPGGTEYLEAQRRFNNNK